MIAEVFSFVKKKSTKKARESSLARKKYIQRLYADRFGIELFGLGLC